MLKADKLKSSSGCMMEIFEFFEMHDLHRLQNLNRRFYNQTVPRLIYRSPISCEDLSYSFSPSVFSDTYSVVLGFPKLEGPSMFIGDGKQPDKELRLFHDVVIQSL